MQRQMGQDTVLIVDAMNYIKGFRYQMYCAARELKLRVCTVSTSFPLAIGELCVNLVGSRCTSLQPRSFVDSGTGRGRTERRIQQRREWLLLSDLFYRILTHVRSFENLLMRFEEPSSMVRWDSPLITVPWVDTDVPIDEVWKAITEGAVKPPNAGTQAVRPLFT